MSVVALLTMAKWSDVRKVGLALPEAEESTSYRERALKVGGKTFAHMSPHEEGALVVRVDPEERPLLIESNPDIYFITPHYENYPRLLIRLKSARVDDIRDLIEDSWLIAAPKRLAAKFASR
jgi:Uncharacterized protein conserved in bacteria